MVLDSVNEVLNYYCPPKKVSNYKKKEPKQAMDNPSQVILKSTTIKNRLHRKVCRTKNIMRKTKGEKS